MKTPSRRRSATRFNYLILFGILLFAVVGLALPAVHSSSPAEPSAGNKAGSRFFGAPQVPGYAKWLRGIAPAPLAETMETFAADCVTPKSAFLLGETVCAKTDDVDLGFAGGRWVHWLRQNLSIASGSSTTTLITTNPQLFAFVPDQTGTWKVTIAEMGDDSQTPAVFTVTQAPESIATYDSTCTFAKDHFNSGETVCAKAEASFSGTRYIYWVDDEGTAIQVDAITSGSPSATRTFTETGNFWAYFSDDESLRSKHAFSVSDPSEPQVNLGVFKNRITGSDVVAGGFVTYEIRVANRGPDIASTVKLMDAVPLNLTYVTSTQDSGPAFTKTQDTPTTTWEIASLPAGANARFSFTYQVGSVAVGDHIENTATVSTTTQETHTPDDTSTDVATVVSGAPGGDCVLDCPNDVVRTATTSGVGGGANVTFSAAEGFGSCGMITASPASGSFFPIGDTTVTVTSSTGGGGCSFKVTVVDSNGPSITCPANITTTANEGDSGAFVPNPNGSSSNVGTATGTGDMPLEITGSREDGDALINSYPFGVTDITWIATDPSGRQATCTQKVTVLANTPLTITCPANVTAPSPSGCDPATVNVGTPTSNSSTATIVGRRSDNLAFSTDAAFNDPYAVGTTTIEWIATGADTQSASCVQTVTVTTASGGGAPTLDVPPNITVSTSSCSATLDDELGVATAESSCGTVNITRTGIPQTPCPIPGNPGRTCDSFVFPTGTTVITYTATGPGGTTTGTQTVTVLESPAVNPTITAPNDLTVNTGPGATSCGIVIGDATLGSATANDNCPGVTVTRTGVPAGNNFPVGSTTITYTATDRNGNTAMDTQVITVIDNTVPVITLSQPSENPQYVECHTSYTELGATATDNCPTSPFAATPSGTVDVDTPGTYTITYNATDSNGNAAVPVTRTVIVRDTIAPVITLNTFSPTLWPPNHKYTTFQLTQFVTGASDSCDMPLGLDQVVIEKVTSDETENGGGDGNTLNDMIIAANCKSVQLRAERNGGGNGRVYTITFKVTDASGNVGRATAKVRVPHNNGSTAVEDAVQYTVNGSCP